MADVLAQEDRGEETWWPPDASTKTDVDFEAIDGDLAKLAPPKLSLKDVLDRLRERMLEQRAKGVTVAQMHEVLKARGIEIGERSLKGIPRQGRAAGTEGCQGPRLRRREQRSGGDPF